MSCPKHAFCKPVCFCDLSTCRLSSLIIVLLVIPCHVLSCHVLSCVVSSCLVLSCHVMCCVVMCCHVMCCHVMCCHVMSCHVMCYAALRPNFLPYLEVELVLQLQHHLVVFYGSRAEALALPLGVLVSVRTPQPLHHSRYTSSVPLHHSHNTIVLRHEVDSTTKQTQDTITPNNQKQRINTTCIPPHIQVQINQPF